MFFYGGKMETEMWRDIEGFEGLYQISSYGRVKSLQMYTMGRIIKRDKILKPFSNGNGYLVVHLRKNNKRFVKYVHRLVSEAFIPNPNKYPCINHMDESKNNNKADNLEWCTFRYNNNYGNHNIKLSKSKLKLVDQYDKDLNLVRTWEGIRKAMKETNCSHIVECCKGKVKSSGGFIWKYHETSS